MWERPQHPHHVATALTPGIAVRRELTLDPELHLSHIILQFSKMSASGRPAMVNRWLLVRQLTNTEPVREPGLTLDHHAPAHSRPTPTRQMRTEERAPV